MSRYILKDQGYGTFKYIVSGRQNVGRVATHAQGGYVGVIGTTSARADTEAQAFSEVVAKHCGYASAADMQAKIAAHNKRVRAHNKAAKAQARHVMGEILNGNFKPLDELFGFKN